MQIGGLLHGLAGIALIFCIVSAPLEREAWGKVWSVKQMTFSTADQRYPRLEKEILVWWGIGDDRKLAIHHMNLKTGLVRNLTSGKITGFVGTPSLSNGQVAWRGYNHVDTQSIFLWDGSDIKVVYQYKNGPYPPYWGYPPSYHSLDPMLDNGQITFAAWDGNDYEIFLWDSTGLRQITNNLVDDFEPQIQGGQLSWTGWSSVTNSLDVFFWDGSTVQNVSSRAGVDEDSYIRNGKIVWCGVNYSQDRLFDIYHWDGSEVSNVKFVAGNDFEPEISANFTVWTNWTKGYPQAYVWDGYKLFNIMPSSSEEVLDPSSDGQNVVFAAGASNQHNIYLATYVTGTYHPLKVSGITRNLVVGNDIAYVANGIGDLKIVDISDQSNPAEIVKLFANDGYETFDVEKKGNYLFLACRGAGLKVINVTDPTAPYEVTTLKTIDYATNLTLAGDLLYLGDRLGGMRIYDVSDPESISELGSLESIGQTHGIGVKDDYALIANYWNGVKIADVSNPLKPVVSGKLSLSKTCVWDIKLRGDLAYLVCPGLGLKIYDARDPSKLSFLADCPIPDGSMTGYLQPPLDVVFQGNYAFVGNGSKGVFVIDVSNPVSPLIVERIAIDGYVHGVTIAGKYLYASAGKNGFQTIDISDYQ